MRYAVPGKKSSCNNDTSQLAAGFNQIPMLKFKGSRRTKGLLMIILALLCLAGAIYFLMNLN